MSVHQTKKVEDWAAMRLMECVRLRVKDVDFAMRQITVRDGRAVAG